jgi:hypothetical protein
VGSWPELLLRGDKKGALAAPLFFCQLLLGMMLVMAVMMVVMMTRCEGRSRHGDQQDKESEGVFFMLVSRQR